MFIPRQLTPQLELALRHFPAVLLTGPRQTGKTELLKHAFPTAMYHSFDTLETRRLAATDPRSLLMPDAERIIFDEIQAAPEILHHVKEAIDQDRRPGRFILTGSQQFALMKGVSESLAGRVAIFQLLPFAYGEISPFVSPSLGQLILAGMYPQVQLTADLNRDLWFASYISTYLERDLNRQIAIRDLRAFEAFLQLLASRVGQELNLHKIAAGCGINQITAKAWLSALEAAYIVYLLPPYFRNYGKRVIKSPKLYFLDTGLVCHLVKLRDPEHALTGPMSGALFENFVVVEYLKKFLFAGEKPPLYYWRSHGGIECDLLIDHGAQFQPIQIKLSHTIGPGHAVALRKFLEITGAHAVTPLIISQATHTALPQPIAHQHWSRITTASGESRTGGV